MPEMPRSEPKLANVTLVLLPGLDGTGELFAPFVAALPDRLPTRTIAYPERETDLDALADFVESRLPGGDVVLLAESFSGLVALTLLPRIRKPIKAVIFCASFAETPRPWLVRIVRGLPFQNRLIRLAPDVMLRRCCLGRNAPSALVRDFRRVVEKVPPRMFSHRLGLIARFQPPPGMSIKIPCYFLQAANDRLVPAQRAEWFRPRFTPFHLQRLEGPHMLLQARAQLCAERVMEILKGLEAVGS